MPDDSSSSARRSRSISRSARNSSGRGIVWPSANILLCIVSALRGWMPRTYAMTLRHCSQRVKEPHKHTHHQGCLASWSSCCRDLEVTSNVRSLRCLLPRKLFDRSGSSTVNRAPALNGDSTIHTCRPRLDACSTLLPAGAGGPAGFQRHDGVGRRLQLDRVLDPSNVSVQLDTLIKAARALGKEIEIKIKRPHEKAA